MIKKATITLLAITLTLIAYTQISTQLVNPVPHSPNATSIQKFGDIPVNLYSGIPSIDIPMYSGNSNGYILNVGISYHAGGIKVEEIASCVGLGWALNTGGIISRNVRGIADESANGFFSPITQTRYNQFKNNQLTSQQQEEYLKDIHEGLCDAEPDIFSYSFNGNFGKFYWGNNTQWVTIPRSNLIIDGTPLTGFIITDLNGFIHVFNTKESVMSVITTFSNGTTIEDPNLTEVITSWCLDEVVNGATGVTCLNYEYESVFYNTKTIGTETKYQLYSGSPIYKYPITSTSNNWNYTQRVKKIIFADGYILFAKASSQRCDLIGDFFLESIKIFTSSGQQTNQHIFYYSYIGGDITVCNSFDATNKRLYLDSLKTDLVKTFRFNYYNRSQLPSRLSKSQDYWGFYNGQPNTSLIPGYNFTVQGGNTIFVQGANRYPNFEAKAGTLNRITYPAGGYTELDYELNSALIDSSSDFLQPILRTFAINGDYSGNINYYDTTFEISGGNVSAYLNPNTYLGILANINISGVTCALWPVNEGCGNVKIQCINPSGIFSVYLNHQNNNIFLPNGTYRITADFTSNQDIESYRNFSLFMDWKTKDSIYELSNLIRIPVGGLRIKTLVNDDGLEKKLIKNYSYNYPNTTTTSGFINAIPKYEDLYSEVSFVFIAGMGYTFYPCDYIRRSSTSMLPLLANQSSHVGYSFVTETQINQNNINIGMTVYEFYNLTEFPDEINRTFPYPPPLTFEWKRGLQKSEKKYLKSGNNYSLQYEKVNNYASTNSDQSSYCNISDGLKVGSSGSNTLPFFETQITKNIYKYSKYTISNGWISLVSDTVRQYAENNNVPLTQITNYCYDNEANLKPTRIESINSKNESTKEITRTPLEKIAINNSMPLTIDELNTIDLMVTKNMLNPVLQTQQYKSNTLLNQSVVTYKT